MSVVNWDDVEPYRVQHGHIDAWWQLLSHTAEEEIFYVLEGSGLSWQDGSVYEARTGWPSSSTRSGCGPTTRICRERACRGSGRRGPKRHTRKGWGVRPRG